MSRASIKISEGKLPAELADALEPGLREALDNPARREVLRVIDRSDRALTVSEIAGRIDDFTVSEIGYHVRVLERSGAAEVDGEGQPDGSGRRRYASGVTDDLAARSALRATQQWDRDNRRRETRPSSRHLAMFRIPRPVRTIRLGERDGGDRGERG